MPWTGPRIILTMGLLATAAIVTHLGSVEAAPPQEQALQPTTVTLDGESLRIGVPPAWRKVQDGQTMMFGPENGLTLAAGKTKIVYGIEVGVTPTQYRDPNGVFDEVVQAFNATNPGLRSASITRLVRIAGRLGLRGTFGNASSVTGRPEFVVIATAPLERGRALHVIGMAPEQQFATYRPTFEAILTSIEQAP